jgi:hypothetical protein
MASMTALKIRNIFWMLARPKFLAGWCYRAIRRRFRPDEPWMALGAVRYLQDNLPGGVGFEWGSGRSTVWFAARLSSLISVEEDAGWLHCVRALLDSAGATNVILRHIPIDHDPREPERANYEPLPQYVDYINHFQDGAFRLIIVDGHYRQHCIRAALPKLAPYGLLLVDDSWWGMNNARLIPESWPIVQHAREWSKCTTIWRKPLHGPAAPSVSTGANSAC